MTTAHPNRSFIRHVVFFSARKPEDVPNIVEGLSRLKAIPHATTFEVSENGRNDPLSDEVDVVVYAEFEDEAALNAYKSHQIYKDCIDIVRPLRELRIAANF